MQNKITIGFSVNPEIIPTYDRMTRDEKAILEDISCELGGTSANVAKAIYNLTGEESKVFALTSENPNDFNTHCLRFAAKSYPMVLHEISIMNKSNMALIPIDGLSHSKSIWGFKGKIDESKVNDFIPLIQKDESLWKIATGVRPELYGLTNALFSDNSCNSLNPNRKIISNKELFFSLLKRTDLLIMNMVEYEFFTENYKEINSMETMLDLGPNMVIVTNGEKGGKFHLRNSLTEIREKFNPCTDYTKNGQTVYAAGTGDWFHGAFISKCLELGKNIKTLSSENAIDAISFATKVSGKKVTMLGAGNGPTIDDF